MPGMSGRELEEALRGRRPETRTLFISGYSNDVIARSGDPQNVVLLEKPFSRTSLLQRVRETLSAPRG
jgi:FixJ family two-component response regulator